MKIFQTNIYNQNQISIKRQYPKTSFKGSYEIDTSSAVSRSQVLTLGMLMNNFWIKNARNTFNQAKYQGAYGNLRVETSGIRDNIIEKILKYNNITYKKLDKENLGGKLNGSI